MLHNEDPALKGKEDQETAARAQLSVLRYSQHQTPTTKNGHRGLILIPQPPGVLPSSTLRGGYGLVPLRVV